MQQPAVFGGQPMYQQGQPRPQQPGQATQDPFVSHTILITGACMMWEETVM